jgi:hypothetical protein
MKFIKKWESFGSDASLGSDLVDRLSGKRHVKVTELEPLGFIIDIDPSKIVTEEFTNIKATYRDPSYGGIHRYDTVNVILLRDINHAGKKAGVIMKVNCINMDHKKNRGRHPKSDAVDISSMGWDNRSDKDWNRFLKLPSGQTADRRNPCPNKTYCRSVDAVVHELIQMGYKLMTDSKELKEKYPSSIVYNETSEKCIIWRWGSTAEETNHYHHVHISSLSEKISYVEEPPKPAAEKNQPTKSLDRWKRWIKNVKDWFTSDED